MSWSPRTCKMVSLSLGYYCIFVFFALTSYVVYVFYTRLAPSVYEKEQYTKLILHIIFGHWLAINMYFNFIMAWLTSPGYPKDYPNLTQHFSRCKKCPERKPLRTHHCSWCNTCILKYDHHCPWLNNCVGFYNHRYFFQFCCFMTIGCFYAGWFGYREYQISELGEQMFCYMDSFFKPFEILEVMAIAGFITYFVFVAAFTIGFLLLGLTLWHAWMIGQGVTSLERVTNQNYMEQCFRDGYIFVNPYDFGFLGNWQRFFGTHTIGEFIRRVLFPSTHKPHGNGITWDGYNVNTNLDAHQNRYGPVTRPISFPPGVHPFYPNGYPAQKYQSTVLPWEKNSETSSTEATESPKDR